MTISPFKRPKFTVRRLLLAVVALATVAGVVIWTRHATTPNAEAAPPTITNAAPAPASAEPSDYTRRVVAYVNNSPITRERLGEYLIARMGHEKLNHLLNKLILEKAAADHNVTVTDAEVEASLYEDLAQFKGDKRYFIESYLKQAHKSLYEWREDVLRPRLLVTKMLRPTLHVSEDDIRKAHESAYGERVRCQVIIGPVEEFKKFDYAQLRDNPEEFDRAARILNPPRLASVAGQMDPFGRYTSENPQLNDLVFNKLKEGEVSAIMEMPGQAEEGKPKEAQQKYAFVVKLLKRIPADPTKKLEDVRPELEKEYLEKMMQAKIPETLEKLKKDADAKIVLEPLLDEKVWSEEKMVPTPANAEQIGRSQEAVAVLFGNFTVTREMLGEYLVRRYGAGKIELLVNKLIIEKECASKGISVSDEEIETMVSGQLKGMEVSRPDFVKRVLKGQETNLYAWREDAVRPRLLMTKLLHDSVHPDEADLKRCFDAKYGERAECQIIMWGRTRNDYEFAVRKYDVMRRDPVEFDRLARSQASPRLAAKAGKIDPFARNTTGNEAFEAEVFKLRPGEITPVVETPEGYVVAKLLKIHEPVKGVTLDNVREQLAAEVLEKKIQREIPIVFRKLRDAADPNIVLKPMLREDDLNRDVEKELAGLPGVNPSKNAGPRN
jgi:parvulin-like peptidyl-prolyl isomerase